MPNTTTPVSDAPDHPRDDLTPVWAFVLMFSAKQPWRVGEVFFLEPGAKVMFGRDGPAFLQQRPGELVVTGPILDDGVSRQQLRINDAGAFGLAVEVVGQCPTYVNGKKVDRKAFVEVEGVISFHSQVTLLVLKRAPAMAALEHFTKEYWGPFGQPNAVGFVGESQAGWGLMERGATVGRSGRHALVTGESGAGKELCAALIHMFGPNPRGPLVKASAAAITPSLATAELFGSVKNYPNAGQPERAGLITQALGGTLFLDEIAKFSQDDQAMLLRAMDGDYKRLGEPFARPCKLVVVAATNRPSSLVHDFRRRFTFLVQLPSLATRREDIPLLVRHIIQREFDKDNQLARDPKAPKGVIRPRPVPQVVIEALLRMSFVDGNVRALEEELFNLLLGAVKAEADADEAVTVDIAKAVLVECKGNVADAGRRLGGWTRDKMVHFIKKNDLEAFVASLRPPK